MTDSTSIPSDKVPRITVREAVDVDLNAIADVHSAAFTGFFLAEMGRPFLTAYYRTVLEYAGHVFLVAENDEKIVGFVAGFLRPHEYYKHLSKRKRRFIIPALWGVLRRPSLLLRLVRRTQRVVAENSHGLERHDKTCELSSVAVNPLTGRRGLGRLLVERFVAETGKTDASEICLTTDALRNDRVNAFYQSLGFELVATLDQDGTRRMNEYRLYLHTNG